MFFILAGGGLLAATRFGDEVIGPAIMFLFALCYSVIAAWSKKNQWAIIPAGIFASLGLVVALEILIPHEEYPRIQGMLIFDVFIWVLFLGLAAIFGTLWLIRKTLPTNWTKYPVVGFLVMAVLSIIEGARFSEYWLETTLLV